MKPIVVDGNTCFVMSSDKTTDVAQSEIICHQCKPPMVICRSNLNDADQNKALRNHAASHQLSQTYPNEHCGLCSICDCSPQVQITVHNRNSILSGQKRIPAAADVQHNCKTYKDLPTMFPYKFCNKTTRGYPCTNKPILCHDCDGIMCFVWSWNIQLHYEHKHGGMSDEQRAKYEGCNVSEKEKKEIKELFKVNGSSVPTQE